MIIFNTIRWKNFLSTGNNFTQINLTKAKTTLINGENGAGKTTLLDALSFCLFGKPFRNINIPQLVNTINEKDCMVEMEFSISNTQYKVVRGLSPKIFEVYKDGNLIDQNAKAKDYQEMLETQVLKMSHKSFCQVVVLGSTNYVPFMRLSAADRRSIVEILLDINIFSIMNTLLKGKVSALKDTMKDVESNIKIIKSKQESQEKLIENINNNNKQNLEKYNTDIENSLKIIDELTTDVEILNNELNTLIQNTDDSVQVQKTKQKLVSLFDQIETNIKTTQTNIEFYENNDVCPSCSQSISAEVKCGHIKEKKDKLLELDTGLNQIKDKIEEVESKLHDIQVIGKKILHTEKEISNKNTQIIGSTKYINKLQSDIVELNNKSDILEKEQVILRELQTNTTQNEDIKKTLLEDGYYYNIISTLIKDSGIKSKIIKHYLPIMNKIINTYLSKMNFFVKFELDETFTETIKSRHRDTFTYDSFSEGEKRKIDLALLFAWRATAQLKNSVNCNLLIFDEVLDGSLDDTSTDAFLDILKDIKKNTNVFVISHKPKEQLQDKFENHITFVKKKNFSTIK